MDTITQKVIFATTEYDKFEILLGNREVTDERVCKIVASVLKYGYITSPIIVNESMEIIDGQGRLEAFKRLRIPVEYIVHPGIGIKECIAMNILNTNWKVHDFIYSYMKQGNKDYSILYNTCQKYPQLDWTSIAPVLANHLGNNCTTSIRKGTFKVKVLAEQIDTMMQNLLLFTDLPQKFDVKTSYFWNAINYIVNIKKYNPYDILSAIQKNYKRAKPSTNTKLFLSTLQEDVINFGKMQKSRIYFCEDYIKDCLIIKNSKEA